MTKFLSEVFQLEDFSRNYINILTSSTGAGKTTLAFKLIHSLSNPKSLYLIDTTNGKESLLQREDTELYNHTWKHYVEKKLIHVNDLKTNQQVEKEMEVIFTPFKNKTVVMTYQQLGSVLQQYDNFLKYLDIIVLDEVHNLIKYFYIERGKLLNQYNKINPNATQEQKSAFLDATCNLFQVVKNLSKIGQWKNYTIALSATPDKFLHFMREMKVNVEQIQTDVELVSYEDKKVQYFTNLEQEMSKIDENEKAIIYIPNIVQMKKAKKWLEKNTSHNVIAIWSIHNQIHPMNEQQMKVREHIKIHKKLPKNISILIINKSYETSINIYDNEVKTLIINTSEQDTVVQIRGRLRQDLDLLKLKRKRNSGFQIEIPENWLEKRLYVDQQKQLAKQLKVYSNNNVLSFRGVAQIIKKQGKYNIKRGSDGRNRWILLQEKQGALS